MSAATTSSVRASTRIRATLTRINIELRARSVSWCLTARRDVSEQGGETHGEPGPGRQRCERRRLEVHAVRIRARRRIDQASPALPEGGNGQYETITGGDSTQDPYPDS
jgi:hypothetical protein